jgi:hypothetical protein
MVATYEYEVQELFISAHISRKLRGDLPWTSKCSHPNDCVIPIPLHSFSSRIRSRPESSCEKYLHGASAVSSRRSRVKGDMLRISGEGKQGQHTIYTDSLFTYDFGISLSICLGRMTCLYSKRSSESYQSAFISHTMPQRDLHRSEYMILHH